MAPDILDRPDRDLGLHLWAWWVGAVALNVNLPDGASFAVDDDFIEKVRAKTLSDDTEIAQFAGLEKALKRCAMDDPTTGGKIFRQWQSREAVFIGALDEIKTGRRRQTHIARRDRSDPLQALILEIVRRRPTIRESELLDALRLHERAGVIEEITDSEIAFTTKSGAQDEAPLSGLKHRLSRARKKLGISPAG